MKNKFGEKRFYHKDTDCGEEGWRAPFTEDCVTHFLIFLDI